MHADWKPLPEAKLRYDSLEEYARVQRALVLEEELDEERRSKNPVAEDVTVVFKQDNRRRVRASFVLESDEAAECGSVVRIYSFKQTVVEGGKVVESYEWWVRATIVECSKATGLMEAAVVESSTGELTSFKGTRHGCSVQHMVVSIPFQRMKAAVDMVRKNPASLSPALRDVLLGRSMPVTQLKMGPLPRLRAPNLPPLNPSQEQAIAHALQHTLTLIQSDGSRFIKTHPLSLTQFMYTDLKRAFQMNFQGRQGPPGTGKTHTVATLVYLLVQQLQPSGGQVLVAAPSNAAVDNLAVRIHRTGLKVVRMYSRLLEEANVELEPPLEEVALHVLCPQQEMSPELEDAERQKLLAAHLELEKEFIKSFDVVCCTCSGAGDSRLDRCWFPYVVIDECTRATEPETLVPLVRGAQKVTLVGDERQDGPLVKSGKAMRAGMDVSFFVRCLLLKQPAVRLNVQYRMHPAIASFPSRQFYDGELQSGVSAKEKTISWAPKAPVVWPRPSMPSIFYHCSSTDEEVGSTGSSLVNRNEAEVVVDLVCHLLKSGAKTEQITVLTFYLGQASFLARLLKARAASDNHEAMRALGAIEPTTVSSFQGKENDIVILSCVRCNPQSGIGFLNDFRRLNVALTRARCCLFLVGNAKMFDCTPADRQKAQKDGDKGAASAKASGNPACPTMREKAAALLLLQSSAWANLLKHYDENKAIVTGRFNQLRRVRLSTLAPNKPYDSASPPGARENGPKPLPLSQGVPNYPQQD
ncbi:hypothetical protein Emag_000069 [Eimeria magna]